MTQLVSPQLLNELRKVGNTGLQGEITLLRRMPVQENPYGDDTESWVTMGEFPAWLRGIGTARLQDTTGNVVAATGVFRLHLKAEVEVRIGDMVVFEDQEFEVNDSNLENTHRVFSTAIIRRKF